MWWKVGHDATEHIPNDEASICAIVYICIYEIIFAGMDETAMKTLLYNPGMEFFDSS